MNSLQNSNSNSNYVRIRVFTDGRYHITTNTTTIAISNTNNSINATANTPFYPSQYTSQTIPSRKRPYYEASVPSSPPNKRIKTSSTINPCIQQNQILQQKNKKLKKLSVEKEQLKAIMKAKNSQIIKLTQEKNQYKWIASALKIQLFIGTEPRRNLINFTYFIETITS